MARNRTIVKSCPTCELQVAVASKSCKCGYSFFNARRVTKTGKSESDERRRTSRVRREKPNYYDSQEFERKKNKRIKGKGKKTLCETRQLAISKQVSKETTAARAKRRRQRKEEEDGEGDLCAKLPQEKQDIAAIILSEINRKLCGVVWKA